MSDIILYIGYVFIGFITGLLSALLGIGGGIVFIPTLLFTLPHIIPGSEIITFISVSTSLFAGSFASSSSCINHIRIKNINKSGALYLAFGTLVTAAITPQIIINVSPEFVKYFVGIILSVVAIKMLIEKEGKAKNLHLPKFVLIFFGGIVGTISAIGGFGGGVFFVPILHYMYGLDVIKSIGTSTFPVAVTMIVSAISYAIATPSESFPFQLGYIHLSSGLILGISSISGAFIGIRLIKKVNSKWLKKLFALLVFVFVIKLLS